MWQWDHHRALAETLAYAIVQRTRAEKSRDRQLADRDQDLRLQQAKLSVKPVRAIRDRSRLRTQVSGVQPVAPGKAAHQRGDIGQASKLICVSEACANHPAVELFACASGKWPSRFTLDCPRCLSDQEERRSPLTLEGGPGLGDDALVDTHVARAAGDLVFEKSSAAG